VTCGRVALGTDCLSWPDRADRVRRARSAAQQLRARREAAAGPRPL